jgi:hypothetical protein
VTAPSSSQSSFSCSSHFYGFTIFPFKIIEHDLPAHWKKQALVVISASANNVYHLKVASDNHWPEFTINHGFNDEEFDCWVKENNFFQGNQQLADVEYWTSRIPYELSLLLQTRVDLGQDAKLENVLESYIDRRYLQLSAQQRQFREEFVHNDADKRHALTAVTLMTLAISTKSYDHFFMLNQQLMFLEDFYIHPITPLARKVLIAYWEELDSVLDKLTQLVFKASVAEISMDVKGRMLEKYIQHQLAVVVVVVVVVLSWPRKCPAQGKVWRTASVHFSYCTIEPGSITSTT